MALEEPRGVLLRAGALVGRDARRPEALPDEHLGIVEVDELGVVGKLELGERERQPEAPKGRLA